MRVVRIKLPVSNAYLVVGQRAVLVDAGAPGQADRILDAVRRADVDPSDISLLIHTHGHIDHAGSTAELRRRVGMPVAVHAADAPLLRSGSNGTVRPRNVEARLVAAVMVRPYEPVEPDLVLTEEISLAGHGVDARVVFTPGHTPGSLSVALPTRDVIVGDLVMGGVLGGALFPRRPRLHYFVDDLAAVHASVGRVLADAPETVLVGHGGPLRAGDVAARLGAGYSGPRL
ncbi:MAG: MBL fold metallo-hydrolase [Actinomycetota bacterium]